MSDSGNTPPRPYYQDDAVTLYCGNCLEVLPKLGPVDHVITDPPFEEQAHTKSRRCKAVGGGKVFGRATTYALPFAPITETLRTQVAALMSDAVRRWCLIFCQVEASQKWRSAVECGAARYMRTCIWVKPDGQPQLTGDRPGMGYESIVACHAMGRSRWNGGGRDGVFKHLKRCGNGANVHPTEKPMGLMRELVSLFTDEGETILDPFAGSGTTLRAAKDLGRNAIGIELNPEYCDIAVERLRQEVLL